MKGHLKLIDFGIAKLINNDTTNIYRNNLIGTINYISPEAISPVNYNNNNNNNIPDTSLPINSNSNPNPNSNSHSNSNSNSNSNSKSNVNSNSIKTSVKNENSNILESGHNNNHNNNDSEMNQNENTKIKIGRASDVWSLGCILYQLIYNYSPFSSLSMIQKLNAIINPNYLIQYPDHIDIDAIESIKACLVRNPMDRVTIRSMINNNNKIGLIDYNFLKPYIYQKNNHNTIIQNTIVEIPVETQTQAQTFILLILIYL